MIKQGIDRLEGIDKNEIVEALIDVIESAEAMGDTVKCFLEKTETKLEVMEPLINSLIENTKAYYENA